MSLDTAERVHGILWDWTVLRLRTELELDRSSRQELARTLYRIGSRPDHAQAMLRLARKESDVEVLVSLVWGCLRILQGMGKVRCREVLASIEILKALEPPCATTLKLLVADMVVRLMLLDLIPACMFPEFDKSMTALLDASFSSFKHNETVDVVLRYLLRRPPSCNVAPRKILPCGGLAWKRALEYLEMSGASVADFRIVVPLRSEYGMHHLMELWDESVHQKFIALYAESDTTLLDGPQLVATFDVLANCASKAEDHLWKAVPGVLGTLETIGYGLTSEDRFRVWDQGWRILERVPAEDLRVYISRILCVVERVPEAGLVTWSKVRIKHALTRMDRASPLPLENVPVLSCPTIVDILPDDMVHRHLDSIVKDFAVHSCYMYAGNQPYGFDLACLRLICRMTPDEVETHHAFVVDHAAVVTQCIAPWQPDPRLKVGARNLLGKMPDMLLEAAMDTMAEIIDEGDGPGMLAMTTVQAFRLEPLARPLLQRVFWELDLYKTGFQASDALFLLCRFPTDVLTPLVDQLVKGKTLQYEDMHFPMPCFKDRIFVLNTLPAHLVTTLHALELARVCFTRDIDNNVVVDDDALQLSMELMVRGHHKTVCEIYRSWIARMLTDAPNRPLRYEAHKMLLLLDTESIAQVLRNIDMRTLYPRHACLVLTKLEQHLLEPFADAILDMIETYPYLDSAVLLLARLPESTILQKWKRILRLMDQKQGFRWDGSRRVLQILAAHGVQEASHLLCETRFKDVLSW